ncbi:MAG: MucBP domain-containing protein, partial [Clostridia bacterium]|nr:MucBP domain-containing protein [Clostridia bacterium]
MKKLSFCLLILALLLTLAVPAHAAETALASTLRLEQAEGSVTIKNASGKAVTSRAGMRLYSGYTVSTAAASYAYISLDDAKAIKLDASSSAVIKQSGKKLEVTLTAGKLFFNVTAPVKADESLSIQTATMVTGVRGTCGWITVVDRHTTRISLLEGDLSITGADPRTGENRTVDLSGGQTATLHFSGVGEGFDPSLIGGSVSLQELIDSGLIKAEDIILTGNGLTVEELQQEEIPGFVAAQVAEDPALQQKIADTTDFDVEQIITDAPERLQQEQAATEQQREQILEAIEQLSADQVDPLFEEEEEPVEEDEDEDEEDDTGSKPPAPAPVDYTLTVNWKTEDGTTLDFDTQTIPSGESYTTTRKEFENYAFSETTGDAVSGTMDGDKTVTYLYRAVTYTLTVKYLDRFDGAELQDATTQSIRGGTTYTVTCPETMYVNRYIGSSQVAAEYRFYKNEGDLSGTMTG